MDNFHYYYVQLSPWIISCSTTIIIVANHQSPPLLLSIATTLSPPSLLLYPPPSLLANTTVETNPYYQSYLPSYRVLPPTASSINTHSSATQSTININQFYHHNLLRSGQSVKHHSLSVYRSYHYHYYYPLTSIITATIHLFYHY